MRGRCSRGDEVAEMRQIDGLPDGGADLGEVVDVAGVVHFAHLGGVDPSQLQLPQAVCGELGVVPGVDERLAEVLVERERLSGYAGVDRYEVVDLAIDDATVRAASHNPATDVLIDRSL